MMARVSQDRLDEIMLDNLLGAAVNAGLEAVKALHVRAMVVYEADVLSGKAKEGGKQWYVADGVCGFAWVSVYGLRGKARARFLARGFDAHSFGGDGRGIGLWISDFNQSMQKKEAFAAAYAAVLRNAGYKAYSGSRMD
jgi:hypothetical protein